jgi:pentatricopeptide repeat protein
MAGRPRHQRLHASLSTLPAVLVSLQEGYSPNSTTYNALISAYGKAGQLDKVMEVFQVGGCLGGWAVGRVGRWVGERVGERRL